ncbi:MAG TPA: VOC family protein [Bryobacteraceae bacterium]|nr:VOC family protein [Bryobacteraceae bacterium]
MDLKLHHVGIVVKDIEHSVQTYLAMGYELRTAVIHDPVQTAFVQFLRIARDSAYIELVSPDGPGSKLANALQKGGGLNHLCYAIPDIEAGCAWLRERGFMAIADPVPAVAFGGRRVAWFRGPDRLLVELVESGAEGEL